nr:unnamed protein product [Callosobruchus chinensis]
MTEDQLNALTILLIQKKFVQSIPDFDNKVIEIFSTRKQGEWILCTKNKGRFFCARPHSEPTSRHCI